MNRSLMQFSLVSYQHDLQRQEVVNVGIVYFTDATPRVVLAPNQGKLLALDPNLRLTTVYDQARRLQDALSAMWASGTPIEELVRICASGKSLSLSPPGVIDLGDQPLEVVNEELQRDLVMAPVKRRVREPRTSRLHSELRQVFRDARILGSRPDDISKHLVVPNFPIDADVGLFAEFALRNGKLHVTETVDFRTTGLSTKRQEAQAKTLLLIQARETVGASELKRYVVVTGASAQVQASMNLLSRHADDFIVRESSQDWNRYVDAMHQAAHPSDPLVQ